MAFCSKEVLNRTQQGFSIILLVTKAIKLFSTVIRISRLALVDQVNRNTRLVCNSSKEPDVATPSVNASTEKVTAHKAMQFCA